MCIIGVILLSVFVFSVVLFKTDIMYTVDISSFYNLSREVRRPITVAQISAITEEEEDEGDEVGGEVVPGTPEWSNEWLSITTVSGGTGGDIVGYICNDGVAVHSAPTVPSNGTMVNVEKAQDYHGKPHNVWTSIEYMSGMPSGVLSGRANGSHLNGKGVMVDSEDRVLVAVGVAVMNPTHETNKKETAAEMRYGTKLDVVLKDASGNLVYVPAVVTECKAHTYPTWVVQTGWGVGADGLTYYTDSSAHKDNWSVPEPFDINKCNSYTGSAAIEFVRSPSTSNCSQYELVGMITYP